MGQDTARRAYVLELDPEHVRHLYARGGVELVEDPISALAEALASSAPVEGAGQWTLAARTGRGSMIGAVGEFTEACVPRLEALRWQVMESLERLRYLDATTTAAACERLAEALRVELGEAGLREARFSAIPRGGLFVLAHLAYLLRLDPEQITAPDGDRPWVLVDDCSISGLRFRQLLDAEGRSGVIFGHLYSHPDLRRAIEADERVRGCLAAEDIRDHAPDLLGDGYVAWRARWEARQGDQFFWVGKTDHLCFPWSEPDVGIWNPVLEREDPGWRVVPPSLCLKNRIQRATGGIALQVHELPGPVRPARGVLHARLGDGIVLARLGEEAASILAGVAGDMWDSLVQRGEMAAAQGDLAALYQAPAEEIAADLVDFAEALRSRGLLELQRHTEDASS